MHGACIVGAKLVGGSQSNAVCHDAHEFIHFSLGCSKEVRLHLLAYLVYGSDFFTSDDADNVFAGNYGFDNLPAGYEVHLFDELREEMSQDDVNNNWAGWSIDICG